MKSVARPLSPVEFPEFTGQQTYMNVADGHTVDMVAPPQYAELIRQMLKDAGIPMETKFFITIDESTVEEGKAHRRGGAHIDGNYLPEFQESGPSWGGGTGYSWGGGWLNGVPGRILTPDHQRACYESMLGGTIIATNYPACKVWDGEFEGTPGQGGSCEHFRDELDQMNQFTMEANTAYLINSTCIHQSMPVQETVKRQLVRLTLDTTVIVH